MTRIARVDMTEPVVRADSLDPGLARAYLCGSGLAAALIAAEEASVPIEEIDLLGPEEILARRQFDRLRRKSP